MSNPASPSTDRHSAGTTPVRDSTREDADDAVIATVRAHHTDGCGCGCGCGHADGARAAAAEPVPEPVERPEELDVRLLPHHTRHETIFDRLDTLRPGGALVIVNDHDPKPLRYQTQALWPERFDWSYLQSGPQQWKVMITRAG